MAQGSTDEGAPDIREHTPQIVTARSCVDPDGNKIGGTRPIRPGRAWPPATRANKHKLTIVQNAQQPQKNFILHNNRISLFNYLNETLQAYAHCLGV